MSVQRVVVAALLVTVGCGGRAPGPSPAGADRAADVAIDPAADTAPVGLEAVRRLEFPPLELDPPETERFTLSNGVEVVFLHDAALPLVNVFVQLRGGYAYFDREDYAAAAGLLPLMRYGGTETFTPDSLDAYVDFHALGVATSTDGARMTLEVNGLRRALDRVVEVWSQILLHPRFDADAVDRWRTQRLEQVRRRSDLPSSVAVLAFNRLMFGDHSTGWVMQPADLAPERVTGARLRALHRRVACPEHAVIAVAGAVTRDTARAVLERALAGWAPCGEVLADPAPPTLRADPRVYVVPSSVAQSTVVVGQPGGVTLQEPGDYFASRLANWIIGGGSFTSRLTNRVRTEAGLAYSAASVWGAARRHPRILGAVTHTRADRTVDAARLVLRTFEEARSDPPDSAEVALARDAIATGFVFGFESPARIVARQAGYLAADLPADWLTRYFDGIRAVTVDDVTRVIRAHVRPEAMTVLIVGDTTAFDASALGPVTVLDAWWQGAGPPTAGTGTEPPGSR